METVLIAVVAVVTLCIVGLVTTAKEGSRERVTQEAELRELFARLFPGAKLTLWPIFRGSFGAIVHCGELEYSLAGEYLAGEGDGYMHVLRKSGAAEKELFRVSLAGGHTHWEVLKEGLRRLAAEHAKGA
jgi:hypothetical protein